MTGRSWLSLTRTSLPILLSVAVMVFVSACALTQPSPPEGDRTVSALTVEQARKAEPAATATATATENPLIRWGGTIAGIENRADGQTMLEVVSRPLLGGGRPVHNDRSDGRFRALFSTFLDPEIVKPGRDITVLGRFEKLENGKVGESDYVFPVVVTENYRYWKPRVAVKQVHFGHWNAYPFPHRRYDPFWDSWPHPPRR